MAAEIVACACTFLQVKVGLRYCGQEQLGPVLAAISAGTHLTGLQLYFENSSQESDGPGPGEDHLGDMRDIQLHSYLKKLPQLQLLHVSGLKLDPADLVHFTGLTALTNLKFADCRGQLDLGIAAIMHRLTGLRKLKLEVLELSNPLIWVSAASLTNLQKLECMCCDGIAVSDDTLHLLAPLTNLTQLVLDAGQHVYDDDGNESFRSASSSAKRRLLRQLPLLDRIEWV